MPSIFIHEKPVAVYFNFAGDLFDMFCVNDKWQMSFMY